MPILDNNKCYALADTVLQLDKNDNNQVVFCSGPIGLDMATHPAMITYVNKVGQKITLVISDCWVDFEGGR